MEGGFILTPAMPVFEQKEVLRAEIAAMTKDYEKRKKCKVKTTPIQAFSREANQKFQLPYKEVLAAREGR